MGRKRHDLIGRRFGKLLVICLEKHNNTDKWKCQCDCGSETYITTSDLHGRKSCGCSRNDSRPSRRTGVTYHKKVCPICDQNFETIHKHQKTCCVKCGRKIMYIDNPDLQKIQAENGRKQLQLLRDSGQAYIPQPGMHTEEFKQNLRARLLGKSLSLETKQKIKDNHWSRDVEKCKKTVEKTNNTKKTSEKWNSIERRYTLAKYVIDRPECQSTESFFKRGYCQNETTNTEEFYQSGYELSFMKYLNSKKDVLFWTKKHGININYEFSGSSKIYRPDLLIHFISGFKSIVELKGYERIPEMIEYKVNAGIEYCNLNNLHYQIIYFKIDHFEDLRCQ